MSNHGKYKYLFKNIGLLTVSQFGSKIISFLLIPLYTSILSTEEYGIYDLLNVTVSLCMPIFTLNIAESVLRFSLEEDADFKSIFSISVRVFLKGLLIFVTLLFVNNVMGVFTIFIDYGIFFIGYYVLSCLFQILSNFARGIDDVLAVSISGLISSFVTIGLNVIFLVPLHLGLQGYFLASILGLLTTIFYLCIRIKVWRFISFGHTSKALQGKMTKYSSPLILNSIGWWVNSASDRFVVTALCGMAVNGIYSIAYKIPSIITVFQGIFNGAWVLSSVREFDKEDKDGFFRQTYEAYNALMVLICSFLISTTKVIAGILYAKDFYQAWIYAPFLIISVIFGAMSGYIGGIFSALKDSKTFGISTIIGAVFNFFLNILLVKCIGAIGAAISTVISYILVWFIRLVIVKRKMRFNILISRDVLSYILLLVQTVVLFITDHPFLYIVVLSTIPVVEALFYRREILMIYRKCKDFVQSRL